MPNKADRFVEGRLAYWSRFCTGETLYSKVYFDVKNKYENIPPEYVRALDTAADIIVADIKKLV
jgi:hypothetical protein